MKKTDPNYYSTIAKLSHRKSPRSKAYYRAIQRKSVAKRKANNKLSTV